MCAVHIKMNSMLIFVDQSWYRPGITFMRPGLWLSSKPEGEEGVLIFRSIFDVAQHCALKISSHKQLVQG